MAYCIVLKNDKGEISNYYYGNRNTGFAYQTAPIYYSAFAIVGWRFDTRWNSKLMKTEKYQRQCTWPAKTYETLRGAKIACGMLAEKAEVVEVTTEMEKLVKEMCKKYKI